MAESYVDIYEMPHQDWYRTIYNQPGVISLDELGEVTIADPENSDVDVTDGIADKQVFKYAIQRILLLSTEESNITSYQFSSDL